MKTIFIGGPLHGQVRDDPGMPQFGHGAPSSEPGFPLRYYYYRHRLTIPDENLDGPVYSSEPGQDWLNEHKALIAEFLRKNA